MLIANNTSIKKKDEAIFSKKIIHCYKFIKILIDVFYQTNSFILATDKGKYMQLLVQLFQLFNRYVQLLTR